MNQSQIINEVNAIIKHRNYTKLVKPRKNRAATYLIKAGADYDIYGSYASETYYIMIDGQLMQLA